MNFLLTAVLAATIPTIPIRNPFWPVGFQGQRESITDQPRIEIRTSSEDEEKRDLETSVNDETIAAAREAAAEEALQGNFSERLWRAARDSLKFGGTMKTGGAKPRQAITINGKIYSDGDYISVNHSGNRFTWRIKALTDGGTLKLQRIRYRELDNEYQDEEKGK